MYLARRFALAGLAALGSASLGSCGSPTAADDVAGDVASVAIDPPAPTVVIGTAVALSAVVQDASGRPASGVAVVWSVKDASVAAVSQTGMVTGRAVGTTQVAASVNGVSAVASVTVSPVPVGSIAIVPSSATVTTGQTVALAPAVKDANGLVVTDRAIVWSSNDDRIATVSTAGVVRGVAAGPAVISATSEGVTGTAAITVVNVAVASVAVLPTSANLQRGATAVLTATVKDVTGSVATDRQVTWSTSNASVAGVSSTGVVTGNAIGTATITASSGGKSGNAAISVVPIPVGSVTVDPTTADLMVGQTIAITPTVRDANGTVVTDRLVTWSSGNTAVATVSSAGVVTAKSAGTATISTTSEGKSATVAVTVQPAVSFVLVSPSLVLIRKTGTVQLSAAAYDANSNRIFGRPVTWSSDDPSIATVDATGLVTTKKAGVVQISATIDGKSDSSLITVTN
jgi:uncharacterized protein YjdB